MRHDTDKRRFDDNTGATLKQAHQSSFLLEREHTKQQQTRHRGKPELDTCTPCHLGMQYVSHDAVVNEIVMNA